MKIKFPFTGKRRVMNQDQTNPTEEQKIDQNPADELKLQSEVEASEQMPIEEDPIAKLTADLAEQKDNYLRLYADFENYKKRALKDRSDLIKSAGSDTLAALLPVLDDFDRAMKAMETAADSPVKEGVTLIHNKLISTLEQRGLKVMVAMGEEFNVDMHEAITNIPVADESQKGKVVDVLEKGYYLNDKVIRYAKVVVGN
jgi:molecular chaperone GrpE